jgi:hypothetical protein
MDAGSSSTPGSFGTGIVVGDGARFGLGSRATLCGETERWRASAEARTRADLERRACQRGGQSRGEGPRGPGCGMQAASCWRDENKMWRGGQPEGAAEAGDGEIQELLETWVLESGVWRPSRLR